MSVQTYLQPTMEEWLDKFRFSTDTKVRVCETDLLGHVNNTSYSLYFEQGRADYLEHLGFYENNDVMFVVGDIYFKFHQEAYVRDKLTIKVRTARFGTKSFIIESAIIRQSTGELIASNWTTIILVDRTTRKSIVLTPSVKKAIQELEQNDSLL